MANFHFCFLIIFTGILANGHGDGMNNDKIKISQGLRTTIEQYPSLVQMESYFPNQDSWYQTCAANILNENYVLSAAHCFNSVTYRRIRAGSSIRHTGGVVVNLANVYVHPNYRAEVMDCDISVAQLSYPLQYSSTIKPATLVYGDIEIPEGTEVRAAGWGQTSQHGSQSDFLLDITIYTINHEECLRRNQVFGTPYDLTNNMICAGLLDIGGRDSCPGDSGGGLFYQDTLIGVVSWSRGCGNSFFPGVYTKISPFRYWIESIVNNN